MFCLLPRCYNAMPSPSPVL